MWNYIHITAWQYFKTPLTVKNTKLISLDWVMVSYVLIIVGAQWAERGVQADIGT